MLRPCLDSLSLLINDFYHISGRFDRNSEEQEEGKKISVGVSVEILHSRNRCYYLNDEEKCCKIVGRGIKVHGSRVYRVFRCISRRDFLHGPRWRTRNILFFFFQVYRWHVQYQSGFYFKRTFHALPSRPVFLIRSREDPTSLSLSRSFRIKQEKLSNRRLTTNKIISTLVPSLVQGEERERERRKERKKEGRETKGTNDLQTQKDHESLALSRTLEIHPRGLHNHIF